MAAGTGVRAGAGRAPSAEPAEHSAMLGYWNSAVTSYYLLTGTTVLLLSLGLVMVLSSSSVDSLAAGHSPYAIALNQGLYALIGLPLLWLASRTPPKVLKRVAWPLLGAAVFAQLLVFSPLGVTRNGNRNWLVIAGQSIQPSEAAKIALAIWLGAVLARKRPLLHQWSHVALPMLPVAVLVVALVLLGHDLGTALILLLIIAGALFVAGAPIRMLVVMGGGAGLVVWWLIDTSKNHSGRITSWLSSNCDIASACYQTQHGIWGLASGGWWGLGLGASREKWSYLPEAHNDFIFAIIGEELGLLGTLLVLVLFGVMALVITRIVHRHKDPFVKIATGAIGCWLLGQALINIGVVIGLLPVVGVPLPLVSAGGSALITTMVALGILISFARTEPGAAEALAARPGLVRRSLAVVSRSRARRV
jgi:cell division protein FtsW